MVLDNASDATASGSSHDSTPPNDNDPYNNNKQDYDYDTHNSETTVSNGAVNYHIDVTKLPQPWPIGGRLFGHTEQNLVAVLGMKIQAAQSFMNRPLTQEEVQAFAYHSSKQLSITSYGPPIGISFGLWRSHSTAESFRFPFYKPSLQEFTPQQLARLASPSGFYMAHALRGSAYGLVGYILGDILARTYGTTVAAVGEMTDKRLHAFVVAARERAKLLQSRGRVPNEGPNANANAGQNTSPNQRQEQGMQQTQGPRAQAIDDASPTGGAYGDTVDYGFSESQQQAQQTNMAGAGQQQQPQQQQQQQQAPFQTSRPAAQRAPPPESEPFTLFDDASATSGAQNQQAQQGAGNQNSSGSVWERLRQQATTKPNNQGQSSDWPTEQSPNQAQGNGSSWQRRQTAAAQNATPGDDSFSYSKGDEEKGYAKAQAQKEFDARVEAERGGGDFSGRAGAGDQKRW